jgi:hypothetical protein
VDLGKPRSLAPRDQPSPEFVELLVKLGVE